MPCFPDFYDPWVHFQGSETSTRNRLLMIQMMTLNTKRNDRIVQAPPVLQAHEEFFSFFPFFSFVLAVLVIPISF